jgi:hypothetical protein
MKKISQSLLKDMLGDYCEYYLKLKYIDGIETEPTIAMMGGLAFESKLIGSARGGVFEYPKLKNGNISKKEKDIDKVVIFAEKVLKEMNIKIGDVQVEMVKDNRIGHIDAESSINSKLFLLDVKYTGLSYAQYQKELQWSSLSSSLIIQAKQYQSLYSKPLTFVFAVFSEKLWTRFFEVTFVKEDIEDHINLCDLKLNEFNNLKFTPAEDANKCAVCRLNNICEKICYKPKIETLINI